jgi:hypothetical protein
VRVLLLLCEESQVRGSGQVVGPLSPLSGLGDGSGFAAHLCDFHVYSFSGRARRGATDNRRRCLLTHYVTALPLKRRRSPEKAIFIKSR